MLRSLDIKNFTAFPSARLDFGTRLNVVIGENGLGKTHLLKLPYAVLGARAELDRGPNGRRPTKGVLQRALAEKLVGVFRPQSLGRLARRQQGRERVRIEVAFGGSEHLTAPSRPERESHLVFRFATNSQTEVAVESLPNGWTAEPPVFLPTRELLTLYPGLRAQYRDRYLEIEETWIDACELLEKPALRGPTEREIGKLLRPIEEAMGGKVVLDHNGRFYLKSYGKGTFEMPLVAEGHRKFAMLARLLVNGSLLERACLFWDEPEANLNPVLIRYAAQAIAGISRSGIQTFVATHSLFLLRELEILLRRDGATGDGCRWFALRQTEDGVAVEQGDSVEALQTIAALDASLDQSDRFLTAE